MLHLLGVTHMFLSLSNLYSSNIAKSDSRNGRKQKQDAIGSWQTFSCHLRTLATDRIHFLRCGMTVITSAISPRETRRREVFVDRLLCPPLSGKLLDKVAAGRASRGVALIRISVSLFYIAPVELGAWATITQHSNSRRCPRSLGAGTQLLH